LYQQLHDSLGTLIYELEHLYIAANTLTIIELSLAKASTTSSMGQIAAPWGIPEFRNGCLIAKEGKGLGKKDLLYDTQVSNNEWGTTGGQVHRCRFSMTHPE